MNRCGTIWFMQISSVLWVALGGSLGASSRYLLGLAMTSYFPQYPAGTLLVNLIGSLVAGLLLGLSLHHTSPNPTFMLVFMTGFLGSFTTFSAFGYETHTLWLTAKNTALAHVFANVIGSLTLVAVGVFITQFFKTR